MSKGGTGVKNAAQLDQLTWLASVKVAGKRSSSGGGESVVDSAGPSRIGSGSRPPSGPHRSLSEMSLHPRSSSQSRGTDERKENDNNQSLQDE